MPEAALADLRERLRRTRWPEPETVADWSQGTPLAYVRELCQYWLKEYEWPAAQARLNRFPQFLTRIDDLDIHFLHVRSPHPDATPLIMTHGWPGSVVEFRKVIEPLTDPVAFGGSPADAFHVVCPTLPGFGFSGKPARPGWGVERIADAWDQLMARLGYPRYGAQGGDWGSMVTAALGRRHPARVLGVHLNMVIAFPDPGTISDLTAREQAGAGRRRPPPRPGRRVRHDPVDPPAEHRLRPGRLPGRAVRLDRGEVPGLERLRRRPRHRLQPARSCSTTSCCTG